MSLAQHVNLHGIVCVFALSTMLFMCIFYTPRAGSYDVHLLAEHIRAVCAQAPYRPSCYDKEIPKLMDTGVSMEDAFVVTKLIQNVDHAYWYCHVLGHYLSAKEVKLNHTPWNKVIPRCPFGQCSNGCLHGAFQERFRGEAISDDELRRLMPDFEDICRRDSSSRHLTGLEQASCYHAIGHLTMYVTNGRMQPSLALCDKIAHDGSGDFTQLCYDGAFMQVFQPLEPEDEALVRDFAPKTLQESELFCNEFSGTMHDSCKTESWPKYISTFKKTPRSIETFCGTTSGQTMSRCYGAIFYVMAPHVDLDVDRLHTFCDQLTFARGRCFAHSASRMIETDHRLAARAVALCDMASGEDRDYCYQELVFYSAYNYFDGTPEHTELCDALPEPYRGTCFSPEGKVLTKPYYSDAQIVK